MADSDSVPDAFLRFTYDQLDQGGQTLQGESVDSSFPLTFVLQNYSFSLNGYTPPGGSAGGGGASGGSGGGASSGGGGGGSGGPPPFPPFEVTMATQIGSPWLMKLCTQFGSGQPDLVAKLKIEAAEVFIRKAGASWGGGSGQEWFLYYCLGGVTIANYKTSIECQDTFALNYESMTVQYWRCDPDTGQIMLSPEPPLAPVSYQSRTWQIGAPA